MKLSLRQKYAKRQKYTKRHMLEIPKQGGCRRDVCLVQSFIIDRQLKDGMIFDLHSFLLCFPEPVNTIINQSNSWSHCSLLGESSCDDRNFWVTVLSSVSFNGKIREGCSSTKEKNKQRKTTKKLRKHRNKFVAKTTERTRPRYIGTSQCWAPKFSCSKRRLFGRSVRVSFVRNVNLPQFCNIVDTKTRTGLNELGLRCIEHKKGERNPEGKSTLTSLWVTSVFACGTMPRGLKSF